MLSTSERIVRAGAQIIAYEGFRMFTAKRIGEKLGISDAAIFKHFPTMESIAEEIISLFTTECLRRIDEATASGKNALEKFSMIVDGHIDLLEETKGVAPLLCFEFARSNKQKLRKRIFEFMNTYTMKIGEVLADGIREGSIRRDIDIDEVSFSLIGVMQAKVFQWLAQGKRGKIVKDRESLKRMIVEGLINRQP